MKKVFFIEKEEDIGILVKNKEKDDILVALSPLAACAMEKRGLVYKVIADEYYSHKELHDVLLNQRKNIKDIMRHLDEILFKLDDRFREINMGPFYSSLFATEMPILNIFIRLFQLKSIFDMEKPAEVKIINQGELSSVNIRFIKSKGSLINEIIKLLQPHFNYELISFEPAVEYAKVEAYKRFMFSNSISDNLAKLKIAAVSWLVKARDLMSHSIYWVSAISFKATKTRYGRILNVNCRELESIKLELLKKGWIVDDFPNKDYEKSNIVYKYRFTNEFQRAFNNDIKLKNIFTFLGISYYEIASKQILKYCHCLESLLVNFGWLNKYIGASKYDLVFFNTHSNWENQNQILPIILKQLNIPYVCWMHGGYGAHATVSGFESSDFLLGDKYFVYGNQVKELIDANYSSYGLETYVAGSPFYEKNYRKYVKPSNKKKVITYILGGFGYPINAAYTTECIKYKMFGYWVPMKSIFKILLKYQHDYDIIIRPYPENIQVQFVRKYLADIGANNIQVVTIEQSSLKNILFATDLVICNYVSTSFFESVMTSADIFLLEDSNFTKAAEKVIGERAFYYREIPKMCEKLDQYLQENNFYRKQSEAFLREYLDSDNRETRVELISNMLRKIIRDRNSQKVNSVKVTSIKRQTT